MVRIYEMAESSNKNYDWHMDSRSYEKGTKPGASEGIKVSSLLKSVGDKEADK